MIRNHTYKNPLVSIGVSKAYQDVESVIMRDELATGDTFAETCILLVAKLGEMEKMMDQTEAAYRSALRLHVIDYRRNIELVRKCYEKNTEMRAYMIALYGKAFKASSTMTVKRFNKNMKVCYEAMGLGVQFMADNQEKIVKSV